MILNPNCSEEVFRLSGTVEDIKREIINMLDCVRDEYYAESDDKWRKPILKRIRDMKKRVKAITDIDELWSIIFNFTCNYETYFRPSVDLGDIYVDVATCNNHIWDRVDKEYYPDNSDNSYYEVSGREHMKLISKGYKWVLLGEMDNEDWSKITKYRLFEIEDGFTFKDLEKAYSSDNVVVRRLYDDEFCSYNTDGKIIKLNKMKDKKKIERLAEKFMVEIL